METEKNPDKSKMKEKPIKDDQHEKDKIQQKFNTLNKNKTNQSGTSTKAVPLSHLRSFAILRCGSITQFSQKLGIDRSMGWKILTGNYIPKKISTIEKIAEVLGLKSVVVIEIFRNLQSYIIHSKKLQ